MKTRIHYGWVVIFTGLLVTIGAHGFGRMSYTLILPAMKDGLHFNYTQLGLLGTGNFVGYLVMAIVGGFLAARIGTRIVIALALALMGITMVLTGLAETFSFAFSMRLLTGLGNGAAYVPAMALGSAWFAVERRGFATGIVSAGIGGGTMISGLIVPVILKAYGAEGWQFAWYYLGGAVLVIAGIAALLIRSRPQFCARDHFRRVGWCSGMGQGLHHGPGLVPGDRVLHVRPFLHHLYDLFRSLPG
jgi:MFS family permease